MCSPAIFFVIGATGTGKTAVSVQLARRLKDHHQFHYVCVINADVLQFYSGLPVATNKASPVELLFSDGSPIPHFFLSFLSHHGAVERSPTVDYHCREVSAAVSPPSAPREAPAVTERGGLATGSVSSRPYHIHDYVKDVMAFLNDVVFTTHCNCANKQSSSPESLASVSTSCSAACRCCAVIFCGGSNYYLQALLFDNTLVPSSSPSSSGTYEAAGTTCEPAVEHLIDGMPLNSPTAQSAASVLPSTVEKDRATDVRTDNLLWRKLNAVDSRAAATVHPRNVRRVQRMLEIYECTGRLPSEIYGAQHQSKDKLEQWHCRWCGKEEGSDGVVLPNGRVVLPTLTILWVDGDRDWLDARLNHRLETMVQNGLIDEIKEFSSWMSAAGSKITKRNRDDGPRNDSDETVTDEPLLRRNGAERDDGGDTHAAARGTIAEAIGFKEWITYLQATAAEGCSLCDPVDMEQLERSCLERAQAATRRYARQQVQWIRNRFLCNAARRAFASSSRGDEEASARGRRSTVFLRLQMDVCLAAHALETAVHAVCDAAIDRDTCRFEDLPGVVDVLRPSVPPPETPPQGERDKNTLHYCSMCDMHLCGELQWGSHVSSKRHLGALRHAALVEEQKLLGRIIPPRTRNQRQ